jgi:hypothetical protein
MVGGYAMIVAEQKSCKETVVVFSLDKYVLRMTPNDRHGGETDFLLGCSKMDVFPRFGYRG